MCEKAVLGRKELTLQSLQSGEDISEVDRFMLNYRWSSFITYLQFSPPESVYIDMFVYTSIEGSDFPV